VAVLLVDGSSTLASGPVARAFGPSLQARPLDETRVSSLTTGSPPLFDEYVSQTPCVAVRSQLVRSGRLDDGFGVSL
jgi:hypothetical protein